MAIRLTPEELAVCGEMRKARQIVTGKKGGTYVAGSERQIINKDGVRETIREYVKPGAGGSSQTSAGDAPRIPRVVAKPESPTRRDPRLPEAGTPITKDVDGKKVSAVESADGSFRVSVDGKESGTGRTLTQAVSRATGKPVSVSDMVGAPAGEGVTVHGVKIPPGYRVIWQSESPNGNARGLLAKVKDSKDRTKPIYTAEHDRIAAEKKFKRTLTLLRDFAKIQEGIRAGMGSQKDGDRQRFEALALVVDTGMRPGSDNDTKASVKAYGATTLQARHVKFEGDSAVFDFIGKNAHRNEFRTDDPAIVAALKARVAAAGGPDVPLWPLATRANVLAAVKSVSPPGTSYKTKDFRTAKGTITATRMVETAPPPKPPTTEAELAKAKKYVAGRVATALSNTAAICLKAYIAPFAWGSWEKGVAV